MNRLLAPLAGLILFAAPVLAPAKDASTSPTDSYFQWIDAVSANDVAKAESLTSKTRKPDLDLKVLCAKVNAKMKAVASKHKPIHEEISEDAAVVVYRVEYADGRITYWMDKLLRENGRWKVVPHLTQKLALRDAEPQE